MKVNDAGGRAHRWDRTVRADDGALADGCHVDANLPRITYEPDG
jgi:hypothetical protein